jgi:cell division protein ZapA
MVRKKEDSMGHVTISVHGREYRMACREGEQKRVAELAAYIETRTAELRGGMKLVQDDKLFLMTALMVADELLETRDELQRALRYLASLGARQPAEPMARVEPVMNRPLDPMPAPAQTDAQIVRPV